jgi:hypothetical protein
MERADKAGEDKAAARDPRNPGGKTVENSFLAVRRHVTEPALQGGKNIAKPPAGEKIAENHPNSP